MVASWCQEELAAGDQFSFSNNYSIPIPIPCSSSSVDELDCSNPADRDRLNAKEPKGGGGGGGGGGGTTAAILPAISSPNHNFPAAAAASKVHDAVAARYKKEMLELLKDAPESCAYEELSLKDLVVVVVEDLPRNIAKHDIAPRLATKAAAAASISQPNSKSRPAPGQRKKEIKLLAQKLRSWRSNSRSMIKGFFLNLFSPAVPADPEKRNKSSGGGGRSSRDGSKSRNKSKKTSTKDGGQAGTAQQQQRKRSGKQQPAVLEIEHGGSSRRTRGCFHLFQNSKNQRSMA